MRRRRGGAGRRAEGGDGCAHGRGRVPCGRGPGRRRVAPGLNDAERP
ncbi:hypothetical protein RC1_2699 [Rhodospirillum centenum SW]|uniref:Uncharacterized protein n=1 Tax=Rhodospirillum centenum (strain ATCC 51521 / SW) TaxID=414684 RepID=B6IUZ2_RHOCS|nr:hypothetical protein RC1_2699 [Rhodospirillum centenum SW]